MLKNTLSAKRVLGRLVLEHEPGNHMKVESRRSKDELSFSGQNRDTSINVAV